MTNLTTMIDRSEKNRRRKRDRQSYYVAGIGGGALFLLLAVGIGFLLLGGKTPALGGGLLGLKAPPGYSKVGESAAGAQVYLPGQGQGHFVKHFGPGVDGVTNPNSYATRNSDDDAVFVLSFRFHLTARP